MNLRGTRLMLQAAADTGVRRFVHLSSAKAYGERSAFPSREDDLVNPSNPTDWPRSYRAILAVLLRSHRPAMRLTSALFGLRPRPGPPHRILIGAPRGMGAGDAGRPSPATPSSSATSAHRRRRRHLSGLGAPRSAVDAVNVGSGIRRPLAALVELFAALSGPSSTSASKAARRGNHRTFAGRPGAADAILNRAPIPLETVSGIRWSPPARKVSGA